MNLDKMRNSIFGKRSPKPKNQQHQPDNSSASHTTLPRTDMSQLGFVEFDVPGASDPTLDIIFVHGLNGNGEKTWKDQESQFCWPKQLSQDLPHARVLLFNYDTFFEPSSQGTNLVRIPTIALKFCHELAGNRSDRGIKKGTRPIVMIGHSLGGLVIEKALVECDRDRSGRLEDILESTISIILFGTPNIGSLASAATRVRVFKQVGELVGYRIPPNIYEALKNHSSELLDLLKSFRELDMWRTPQAEIPFILTYYETRAHKKLGAPVVDETSAVVGVRGEVTLGVEADHIQMVKFCHAGDSTYIYVKGFISSATSKYMEEATRREQVQNNLNPRPDLHRRLSYKKRSLENTSSSDRDGQKTSPSDYEDTPQIDHVDRLALREEKNFMGQEEHLGNMDKIFSYLFQPGPKEPHSIGLLGLGGVGKTQLALRYFHVATRRPDNPFTTAFWIDSSSEGALQTAISRIWELIHPQKDHSTEMQTTASHKTVLSRVISSLEKWTRPYLIVFDNANSQAVPSYIPTTGPAAIIITTRLMGAASALNSLVLVRGLAIDTATLLLLRLLECNPAEEDKGKHEEDIKEAKAIVQRLGMLPLAIHAAASYIKRQHLTNYLSHFLPQYEKQKVYMLRQSPHSWGPSGDNQNVFKTWELSLQALGLDEEDRGRKIHFLSVCSFLSPHRISCVHFEQHHWRRSSENCVWCPVHHDWMRIFELSRGVFDRNRFREVITEFEELSLVESCSVDASGLVSFSLHPLVRDWAMIRHGCCDRQAHFAEALICLAATFNACNSVDSLSQPVYRSYEASQPVDWDSPQIYEWLLAIDDELSAHLDSCLTNFEEYEWGPPNLEVLGLKRQDEKSWFSCLFNSILIYAETSGKRSPQIDRLAIKLNEGVLSQVFSSETTRLWVDCELYILLFHQMQDLPYDRETWVERARIQWQRDRCDTRPTFGRLFTTFLQQWWLVETEEPRLFGEGLPALMRQAEDFMEYLIDISKQQSSVGAWQWIKNRRYRTSPFANNPIWTDLGLYWILTIMKILIDVLKTYSKTPQFITQIIEWLENYWLPQSFEIHLRTHQNKRAFSLFIYGLMILGRLQWDLSRVNNLPETFRIFDNLTASHNWLPFALSLSTDFLLLKIFVYRERKEWYKVISYTEEFIQFLKRSKPKSYDTRQVLKFDLAISYLEVGGYEIQADEILTEFLVGATVHDQQLWQCYVRTKKHIAQKYYDKGLYEKAYEMSSQLRREISTNNALADEDIRDAEEAIVFSLTMMLGKKPELPNDHSLKAHLEHLEHTMISLFARWKSSTPQKNPLALVVKYYLSRELWGNARWVLTEYLGIIGNRRCTLKDRDTEEPHPELRHFLIEITHNLRVMDLYPVLERRKLLESAFMIFKKSGSAEEFATCCLNMMVWDASKAKYHYAEICYDWLQTWLATSLKSYIKMSNRLACGMAIKLMLGKRQGAYELFFEDIRRYPKDGRDQSLNRICLSLMQSLPRFPAMTGQPMRHIEIVLISWYLTMDLLGEYWEDDFSSQVCSITQNILMYALKRACNCFICYPVLSSTLVYLYYARDDKQKAIYWIQQSTAGLRNLRDIEHEKIPDDHIPIHKLVDFQLEWVLKYEKWISEMEQEATQDQNPTSSSEGAITSLQYHQRDPSNIWEQAVYSLGPLYGKLKQPRAKLLGVVLLTSGVLGWSVFRTSLMHGSRR